MSNPAATPTALEKPKNGWAGLKHWRHDLPAGLLVSMISVPFSIGIAIASGAPPITGLTSAIIAGFVLPFLGGSYVTISGPAAGLAPVLFSGMLTLGMATLGPDATKAEALTRGYPLLLVAICLAGIVQIFLSWFKAARYAAVFPAAVVEGMLAAIGMLIIVKQFPSLFGYQYEAHEFIHYLTETPQAVMGMNPAVFILGAGSLALIFALASLKAPWLKVVPPQMIVVVIGTIAGLMMMSLTKSDSMMHLTKSDLIAFPENPLEHGMVLPDFAGAFADKSVWLALATIVLTLTMIDGVESLATIAAIDKVDPFRRKSDPNRTLLAMGVSNISSSVIGGLTIIPGGVKSTANIMAGGRTQWANFYNACFLLLFLFLGTDVINKMPKTVLAAVLIFTGFKLCRPAVWRHVARIGSEQLLVFAFTVFVTLATDLLWGIFGGIAFKYVMTLWFAHSASAERARRNGMPARGLRGVLQQSAQLFKSPVTERTRLNGDYHLFFGRQLVCFNALHVSRELDSIPPEAKNVFLHITDDLTMIDHTSCENLFHFAEEHNRSGNARVEIVGLDRMRKRSEVETCMRLGFVEPEEEQVQGMG